MRSRFFIGLLFCAALSACQKPADEGGDSPGGGGDGGIRTGEATTDCGVVTNGKVKNPVNLEDGKTVKVTQILSNNLLIVQDSNGLTEMIKLQGVASANSTSGRQYIQGLTSPDATFFKATKDCNVPLGNGTGSIGQLISRNGQSLTEGLIKRGFAQADPNDACNGNLIGSCLGALRDTPANPDPEPVDSVGEMEMFLWKPLSDTKGPIAVVLERHCNTTIRVNGQALSNGGGSNGRCNTSHGNKSGCGYGKNIRVEVIDNASGKPYTRGGKPFVIVPDGCSRFSF